MKNEVVKVKMGKTCDYDIQVIQVHLLNWILNFLLG